MACSARPNPSVCSSCATPIGSFGDHLKANNNDVPLPYIFDDIDSDDDQDSKPCRHECVRQRRMEIGDLEHSEQTEPLVRHRWT